MARTLPAPYRDRVIGEDGMLTPAWVEYFEQLTGVSGYVFERPTCHVYFSADQSIGDAAWQDLTFDAEDHDNANFHSTTTNTDRLTIPEDGAYCVGAHVLWAANAVGTRGIWILRNTTSAAVATAGILDSRLLDPVTFNNSYPLAVSPLKMNAGDILRLGAFQNSGGALNALGVTVSGPQANAFWCFKIANAVR